MSVKMKIENLPLFRAVFFVFFYTALFILLRLNTFKVLKADGVKNTTEEGSTLVTKSIETFTIMKLKLKSCRNFKVKMKKKDVFDCKNVFSLWFMKHEEKANLIWTSFFEYFLHKDYP